MRRKRRRRNRESDGEKSVTHSQPRRRRKRGRRINISDILIRVLILVFAIVFLVSAFQLFSIYQGYKEGTDIYNELTEYNQWVMESQVEEESGEVVEPGYEAYYVDFEALAETNADIVAWIRFEGPEIINYPVVQTDDNATYLSTSFTGVYNSVGTLFVDAGNSADFTDDNTVIYGHNMKNGSMFGDLSEYIEEEFYLEYPYFYVYTPDGKVSKYQVAIVTEVSETDSYRYTKNFDDELDFMEYILEIYKTSFYDTMAEMDSGDTLITLSTCTAADEERFIVQAVKVEELDMIEPEDVE